MKRLLILSIIFVLLGCSSKQQPEVGSINWQTISFADAQTQAQESQKLLLAYFFTDQ